MRIAAACAVALLALSFLAGCDRSAPGIPDLLPTSIPAGNTPGGAAGGGTPALIAGPTAAATAAPRATVAAAGTPAGGIPLPAQSFKYTVQPGDTLASIAARFNTTVDVVRVLNNIQGDQIAAGQVLTIPGSPPVASNPTTVPPPPTATATRVPTAKPAAQPAARRVTYTVRLGDNLFRIGLRFGVPWRAIARANGISDPTELQVGRVLVIPVGD